MHKETIRPKNRGIVSGSIERRLKTAAHQMCKLYTEHMGDYGIKIRFETKELKAVAQRMRRLERDDKSLEPLGALRGHGRIEKERRGDGKFIEALIKPGRPFELFFVIYLSLFVATALRIYRNAGLKEDWNVIGGVFVDAFFDLLPRDDGRDKADWTRRIFNRYKAMMNSREFWRDGERYSILHNILHDCEVPFAISREKILA